MIYMHVHLVEEEKEKLKIEVRGESAALTHLIASEVWNHGGEAAAVREHPFMAEPSIIVKGKKPKNILKKSAAAVQTKCDEFTTEFRKAMK